MPRLHMQDFMTVKVRDLDLKSAKDSKSGSLLVRVAATHSGTVNGNYRFYRPDRMQDAVHTWKPRSGFGRPILVNHDENCTPLGRVVDAKYIDESHKYTKEYPSIKDSLFYRTDGKKGNLFESVDWIVDNLLDNEDYSGLGYIDLGLNVTNPDAVERVNRNEYLTVSVGFTTGSAICSACKQDWAIDDRCEHKLGSVEDKKPVFLICGDFDYNEVSFVNTPADPFAGVISKDLLTDAVNRQFFLGQDFRTRNKSVSRYALSDGLYDRDIHFESEERMADNAEVKIKTTVEQLESVEGQSSLKTEINAIDSEEGYKQAKELLSAWGPSSEDNKTAKRSLVSTLNVKHRRFKTETKDNQTEAEDEINAAITDVTAVVENTVVKDNVEGFVVSEITFTDAAHGAGFVNGVKTIDGHYRGMSEDGDKSHARGLVGALMSTWYAGDELGYHMGCLKSDSLKDAYAAELAKENLVLASKDALDHVAEIEETLNATQQEKDALESQLDAQKVANVALLNTYKRGLAQAIVMAKTLSGIEGFNLNADQRAAKIDQLSTRHISYLKETMADVISELKWEAALTTDTGKAAEPGLSETQNTQIVETAEDAKEKEETEALAKSQKDAILLNRVLGKFEARRWKASDDFKSVKANKQE